MDVVNRILKLREEKGWSEYKFSVETGIPQSTISSWFRKNAQPSISSVETICRVCGISMAEFFSEDTDEAVYLTPIQKRLIDGFSKLTNSQQEKLVEFLEQ